MKRESIYKAACVITLVSILFTYSPDSVLSQGKAESYLSTTYSKRGQEVIEVQLTKKTVNADGTISADIAFVAKSAPTYGLAVSIENGAISGPALDRFLRVTDTSIPFVGKRTLDIGKVTFGPDANLKIRLHKFGVFEDEGMYIFAFNLSTFITLFTGTGYLPTTKSELIDNIIGAALELVTEFENAGLGGVVFTAQLQRGDVLGAVQTLGKMFILIPQAFADFLRRAYGIIVTSGQIKGLGKILASPFIGTAPLILDLFTKPKAVEVNIRAASLHGTGNVDVVLVIDRSGSMSGQKLETAKTAASLFVDLMRNGDRIGLVSFSDTAAVDYPLSPINDVTKQAAKAAVNGMSAGGNTSIGGGLQSGQQELESQNDPTRRHAIVLLSDGQENRTPFVADVLSDVVAAKTTVFTIGLGNDADRNLLQGISVQTGGTYNFAPDSDQLAMIYNRLAGQVSGQQVVVSSQATITPGETKTHAALISTYEATFAITWVEINIDLDLTLVSPSGRTINSTEADTDPNIEYLESEGYEFYRIISPETGPWAIQVNRPLSVQSADTGQNNNTYTFLVTDLSNLKLDVWTNTDTASIGEAILLKAGLIADEGTISGANVVALVKSTGETLPLFDDGNHNDSDADDGIYATTFTNTHVAGSYSFLVQASGPGFTRETEVTVIASDQVQTATDLWIAQTGPSEIQPGNTVVYSIIFGNNGPNRSISTRLEATLPSNVTFISSTLGPPT